MSQNLKAGLGSALSMLILVFVFQWNFWVSLGLSLGIFFAIYYLTQPVVKIGDVYLEELTNGAELYALIEEAKAELASMKNNQQFIQAASLATAASQLTQVGDDIIHYLEGHPQAISQSRHFLDYYFTTADKIIHNYVQLKQANLSPEKFQLIKERTEESLKLLGHVFQQQRDSYHQNTVLELEVESELLEKTIRLSGGDQE